MGILAGFMVPHPPLIVPEIGKGEEEKISVTIKAYHRAAEEVGRLKPDTIILSSPHQVMYADYFHISPGKEAKGDFRQFRAGKVEIKIKYDSEFIEALASLSEEREIPAGTLGEREKKLDHGTMVPLYFIDQYWKDYKLVRIGLSGLPLTTHYVLGKCIQDVSRELNRRAVFIGSGDLSHYLKEDGPYGYRREGPEYDARIMEVMGKGDFGGLFQFSEDFCERAGECGHRSFAIMAGALDKMAVEAEQLSYEGPFGVGYGICRYLVKGQDEERNFLEQYEEKERKRLEKQRKQEDAFVSLARKTIELYVKSGEKLSVPLGLPDELYEKRAGAFVSLKEEGRLRGCIGTIHPVRTSLAEEIIDNAISACSRDPRFSPVRQEELSKLTITVDVLGETEKITSPKELDVKRYGVVVTKGSRRGLLLPNLEGVDTVEEQISIAKRKAGIREGEKAELERFEVIRHF